MRNLFVHSLPILLQRVNLVSSFDGCDIMWLSVQMYENLMCNELVNKKIKMITASAYMCYWFTYTCTILSLWLKSPEDKVYCISVELSGLQEWQGISFWWLLKKNNSFSVTMQKLMLILQRQSIATASLPTLPTSL